MPPRRPRQPKIETPSNTFLDALHFVGSILSDKGSPLETHLFLYNSWATAFNGIVGTGHKIPEAIFACPNYTLFTQALSKCNEHFSMTQLDNNRISIKSNKFKAIVPCMEPALLQTAIPDMPTFDITDTFKDALEAVGVLANDAADDVAKASIYMNENSLIASNGAIIFEYWHGLQLPFGVALPKQIIAPLIKAKKPLSKFGCSNSSVTFWFNDESWIKTQICADQWPIEIAINIFNKKVDPWPILPDFFTAVEAVAPFSPDGAVYFDAGIMRSHAEEGAGASFEVAGLPKGPVFSAKLLGLIKPYAEKVDFLVNEGKMLAFFGKNIRGIVAGIGK